MVQHLTKQEQGLVRGWIGREKKSVPTAIKLLATKRKACRVPPLSKSAVYIFEGEIHTCSTGPRSAVGVGASLLEALAC